MKVIIEDQDSIYNGKFYESGGFKIRLPAFQSDYVTDDNGNDTFFDFKDFSDVPDYVPKYVTLYNVTREYGGCEEGGWYYDHYEIVVSIRAYGSSVDEVKDFIIKNYKVDLEKEHDRYSVRSSGDYVLLVELNQGERNQPAPHYE